MFDDIHRMGEQQGRSMQRSGQHTREAAVQERMRRWGIEREPAEHILELELRIRELEREADR